MYSDRTRVPFIGDIILIEPLGAETLLHIKAGAQTLVSMVSGMRHLQIGSRVLLKIVCERLYVFQRNGKRV